MTANLGPLYIVITAWNLSVQNLKRIEEGFAVLNAPSIPAEVVETSANLAQDACSHLDDLKAYVDNVTNGGEVSAADAKEAGRLANLVFEIALGFEALARMYEGLAQRVSIEQLHTSNNTVH